MKLENLLNNNQKNKIEDSNIQNTINNESNSFNEDKKESEYIKSFNKFNIYHVRGAQAIRIALLTSIAVFLVDFFNLHQGYWMYIPYFH